MTSNLHRFEDLLNTVNNSYATHADWSNLQDCIEHSCVENAESTVDAAYSAPGQLSEAAAAVALSTLEEILDELDSYCWNHGFVLNA